MTNTKQMDVWSGDFGREYTDRNILKPAELDALYVREFGCSRTAMNEEFLAGIDRSSRILEVGSNVGNQLLLLQQMGFSKLYGVELQPYAVEFAKQRTHGINIIEGSAFDIPFKTGFFDLVFTAGVLIHLSPDHLPSALAEIHRCTRRYVWGMEYFSPEWQEIHYRGHEQLLWKTDYARLFRQQFRDLRSVNFKLFKRADGTEDAMYLLERTA